MKKYNLIIVGIGAVALMVGLNMYHAANNYGILDNNLVLMEVILIVHLLSVNNKLLLAL
jgi:flagellar biosynthesis/type III secretory pathway M-ring protein FliF/YscJ